MPSIAFTSPGSGSWTAPYGVAGGYVTLIMRGCGGRGQDGSGGSGGYSGGGGAYVRYRVPVTGGAVFNYYNGQTNADDSWFRSPTDYVVRAGTVFNGGSSDSPTPYEYCAAGSNGNASGGEAGNNGGNAGDEPGGPATLTAAGGGGGPSNPGLACGGGGGSGGSYYYNNGDVYDTEDPPNFLYTDEGYDNQPGAAGGPSSIEIQWSESPPVYWSQQYIEVWGGTAPAFTQQYMEVWGEVIVPINLALTLQAVACTTWETTFDPQIVLNLTLDSVPVDSFTNGSDYGSEVNISLQTVDVDAPFSAAWGQIFDFNLTLDVVDITQFTPTLPIDVQISPSLDTVEVEFYPVQFGTEIIISLQEVHVGAISPSVMSDVVLLPSLDTVDTTNFTVETTMGAEINLGLQWTGLFDATSIFLVYPTIFTPHPTTMPGVGHFTEPSRSSSSVIVFGTEPGPFKLNVAASVYRRNGRSHVVHLAQVKPQIVENYGLFDMLGAAVELSIEEFDYNAPGGYLRIWNDIVLLSNIQPEGASWAAATSAIIIDANTAQNVSGLISATTFLPPRVISILE